MTRIKPTSELVDEYQRCLRAARNAAPSDAWSALERAHILSQPWAGLHVRTHVAMLRLAVTTRDAEEIVGQVIRTVVAAPGSITGRYPKGNTGRSNVSMMKPMPMSDDLAALMPDDIA